jgi:hypothetical protein
MLIANLLLCQLSRYASPLYPRKTLTQFNSKISPYSLLKIFADFVFEFSLCQHHRCCLLLLAKINIGMFFSLSPQRCRLGKLIFAQLREAGTCICTEGHCMRNCVQCMHIYMQLRRAGGKRLFCSGRPKCVY